MDRGRPKKAEKRQDVSAIVLELERAGMSKAAIGRACGCSAPAVAHWASGENKASRATARKLRALAKVKIEELQR